MAPPSYTTDLTTISAADTSTTGWSEPGTTTPSYALGGVPVLESDYFLQGVNCISQTMTKTGLGCLLYDTTTGITVPTDGAILVWQYFGAPNAINTVANGGMRLVVGDTLTTFKDWYVGGEDFPPYPYGGWVNHALDPSITADNTIGAPGSTLRYIGAAINCDNAVGKGNPHGVDAIRYSRCESRMNGGETADYATFSGFAAVNDATTARWGLIQAVGGGYLVKGLVVFGYSTAVDFRDSNKNLTIQNTTKVSVNFNTFEVRQTGSRVDLTAINITALGTVSPGRWVTTDNATQNITTCTFTDMGVFGYASNSIVTDCTFRRCALVTQNSATFAGSTFENTSDTAKALLVNNPGLVSGCTFTSGGTKHAIELTTACAGNSYTFAGNIFTGYGATGTTNAMIYNNSSGAVTLNVTSGGTYPITYLNGSGASTTITSSVSVTVTILNQAGDPIPGVEVAIFQDNPARTVVLASTATNNLGVVSTSVSTNLGDIIIRARQSTNIATFNTDTGVNFTTEVITTATNHNFRDGDAIVYSKNGGTADVGLTAGTTYYVNNITATTLSLHTTAANAIADTSRVNLLDTASSETHLLDPVRYVSASATGTIGATDFSAQITMITDSIATG